MQTDLNYFVIYVGRSHQVAAFNVIIKVVNLDFMLDVVLISN